MFGIHSFNTGRHARLGGGLVPRTARLTVGAALVLGSVWAAPGLALAQSVPSNLDGTKVWNEDFSGISKPTDVNGWASSKNAGTTYATGPTWAGAAGLCNGWILSSGFANTTGDTGCAGGGGKTWTPPGSITNPTAWQFLQGMADVLNQFNQDNYAVASMTNPNGTKVSQTAGVQLATGTASTTTLGASGTSGNFPPISLVAGHYYVAAVDFAEVHCTEDPNPGTGWTDAQETVSIYINGASPATARFQSSPCTLPIQSSLTVGKMHVGPSYSGAIQAQPGDQITGLQIYNSTAATGANDVAFNNVRILDATPTLYKTFNPASFTDPDYSVGPGAPATLTFAIVNTSDLHAKTGWSFVDTLPPGLTATSISTTCTKSGGESGATIGSAGAASTVNVNADLQEGQSSCTVTVQVTTDPANSTIPYINGPGNGSFGNPTGGGGYPGLNGLLPPPQDATLNVGPLVINKEVTSVTDSSGNSLPAVLNAGDKITYTVTVQNPPTGSTLQNVVMTDSAADTGFTGTGPLTWSCTPVQPATLSAGDSMVCKATYVVQPGDLSLDVIRNVAQAQGKNEHGGSVPPAPAISPPVTTPIDHLGLTLTKTGTVSSFAVGQVATFTFVVKNTSKVDLTDVTINDSLSGITGLTCPSSDLIAGATMTCTATYALTSADVAAGALTNTATASGTAMIGGVPVRNSPEGTVTSQPSTAKLVKSGGGTATPVPALDARALALLALLLGGLAWFTQRKMRR